MVQQEYHTIAQGFSFFFQNNIKLIETIVVYFNTTLNGYYQDELGSSNCFDFLLLQGSWYRLIADQHRSHNKGLLA